MYGKIDDWIKSLPSHVSDGGFAVILAFGFWVSITLLLTLSLAVSSANGNPFADFFQAFGAIGQVVFAFMVWRLGRQQFEFIKRVSHRQARIDTYQHKRELFDRYVEARRNLYIRNLNEAGVWEITVLRREVERLFSNQTIETFTELEDAAWELQEKSEEAEDAEGSGNHEEAASKRKERAAINKRVRKLTIDAYNALNGELRIDPD